jgi:hypothetical protein
MKKINESMSAVLHLLAWLIFLPFLLFLLFKNSQVELLPNDSFNKIVLAMIVGFVGVINSGLLVPRLLYIQKIAQYMATAFTLLVIAVILDLTLSVSINPVLSLFENISFQRIGAIIAAFFISTSIRIILDQKKMESGS